MAKQVKEVVEQTPVVQGTCWYDGVGVPKDRELGNDGDYFLDVESCDIYRKSEGQWKRIGNIRGKTGEAGPQGEKGERGEAGIGEQGLQGEQGEQGLPGLANLWHDGVGVPVNAIGQEGDYYIDVETGDLYRKAVSYWERIGSLGTAASFKEELKFKADKSDTYSKDEVDGLIKNIDLSNFDVDSLVSLENYYTKVDVDRELNLKAGIDDVYRKNVTYTKVQIHSLLDAKIDADQVYNVSESYNRTEIEDFLAEKAGVETVYTKEESNKLFEVKADKESVYSKEEMDELLAEKTNTADVNGLLDKKANNSDVYTKVEMDSKLSKKADSANVYPKAETYSRNEINDLMDDKANADEVMAKDAAYKKSETYNRTEVDGLVKLRATDIGIDGDVIRLKNEDGFIGQGIDKDTLLSFLGL